MMYAGACDNKRWGCGERWSVALPTRYTDGIEFRCTCGRIVHLDYEPNSRDHEAEIIDGRISLDAAVKREG